MIEAELTFELGPESKRITAAAGDFVAVPPNLVHSFVNQGSRDARFINLHTPDKGFAAFLRDSRDGIDASFDSLGPPDDGGLPAAEATAAGPAQA